MTGLLALKNIITVTFSVFLISIRDWYPLKLLDLTRISTTALVHSKNGTRDGDALTEHLPSSKKRTSVQFAEPQDESI